MTQHFTRNTVSASHWCGKCQKQTQHRIDGVRLGPCLPCCEKLQAQHDIDELQRKVEPEQKELFA